VAADFVDALIGRRAGTTVLRMLGGVRVTHRGRRLDLSPDADRLLAFVALRGGRTEADGRVQAHHAVSTLWPATGGRTAVDIRPTLAELSPAGTDLVRADGRYLALAPGVLTDVVAVDRWALRVLCWRHAAGDLSAATGGLLGLDLLPGWRDGWVQRERTRLRQLVLQAVETVSRQLVQAGRADEAVAVAADAVAAEPSRVSARCALLEAHLAAGNWPESCQVFAGYRTLARRGLRSRIPDLGRC